MTSMDFDDEFSYYQGGPSITGTIQGTCTTKIPPSYNGKTSWFAYEDAVYDWIDITELDEVKQGPALKNGLKDEAATYKTTPRQREAQGQRQGSQILPT